MQDAPVVKDLVLVGGGHSHVAVLKRFGMRPIPGVRLTLIGRDVHTPYSGMLPGLIAGHYEFDDTHIDLERLCRFARARFFVDEATGLDLDARIVTCRARPPVPYDVLSLDVGSTPRSQVPGADAHAVGVKPIDGFLARFEALRARVRATEAPLRIAVVGAGAGGVEILLAIQHRLRDEDKGRLEFHLFGEAETVLPSHNARVQRSFTRVLAARGVAVHTGAPVIEVTPDGVRTGDGAFHPGDEVLWVTQAGAAPWVAASGLATDEGGFALVDDALQSVSHKNVFAAGDVATMANHARPKSGVYAVRQGKPLARNLRRALTGRRLRPYRPQKKALALISTGDKYAVASRGDWSVEGRLVWRWKDWIDRRFMRKYDRLPEMKIEAPVVARGLADRDALAALSEVAMRCGGCGAKVGATVLTGALHRLAPFQRPDVLIGLDAPDDAAMVTVPPGKALVQSVDFFRAMIDDPYLFGRIAANHALGDIYAMGAEPQSALAIATVPFAVEAKVEDTLSQMMAGADAVLAEAGCALVGGHSGEGAELALGFAVNGLVAPERALRKSGLRPGDVLILTKPVGTGVLFAADMRHRAKGRWIVAALESMQRSNRDAAATLAAHGATACTDVTGFGLVGHLVEMLRASHAGAALDLAAIPLLDGAVETVAAGIFSSLQAENARLRRAIANAEAVANDPRAALLFDPQTAGGLLAGIPADRAEACLAALRAGGDIAAAILGTVTEATGPDPTIILRG